jgi:transposase-like protein
MNFAISFYQRLRKEAPRRSDFTIDDIRMAIMRLPTHRTLLLVDLAQVIGGEVPCPKCKAGGPHSSAGHHRFGSITFTCSTCNHTFNIKEINS